jgi:hypothetical protein
LILEMIGDDSERSALLSQHGTDVLERLKGILGERDIHHTGQRRAKKGDENVCLLGWSRISMAGVARGEQREDGKVDGLALALNKPLV